MNSYRLTTEVFCLPYAGQFIAYAPLKGVAMLVNCAAVNLLYALERGALAEIDETNLNILSAFMDLGLVNGPEDEVHQDGDDGFRPCETTLFLTTACNLRCRYCYARGGDWPQEMAWPVAKAAVDLVADNVQATGRGALGLSFHGGGEPTVAWDLLVRTALYAKDRADRQQAECRLALATNGILTDEQLDWVAAHIQDVSVSADGVGEVHDRLRPLRSGGPSFERVLHSLRILSEKGTYFGIRMTVTRVNLGHMSEAVAFFCKEAAPRLIHLEPVFQCGRCMTEDVAGPSAPEFVEAFRAARRAADAFGVSLYYSGARYPQVSPIFCQAAGHSFAVTTEGDVTACYEVCNRRDPRAEVFLYGRYDSAAGQFVFDEPKRRRLLDLTVNRVPFCERCFCKYHCAGDCPAKRLASFDEGLPRHVTERCYIAQELNRDLIVRALECTSQTMGTVRREHALAKEAESRER